MSKNYFQPNFLNINSEEKPSRFVVDLKEKLLKEEEEERKREANKWKKVHSKIESYFKKTAQTSQQEVDFVKLKEKLKEKGKNVAQDYKTMRKLINDKSSWRLSNWQKNSYLLGNTSKIYLELAAASSMAMTFFVNKRREIKSIKFKESKAYPKNWQESFYETISQLAFYSLFSCIIIFLKQSALFFYKFSFFLGWLAVFLIRFIYLLTSFLIKPILFPLAIAIGKSIFYVWLKIKVEFKKVKENFSLGIIRKFKEINQVNQKFKKQASLISNFNKSLNLKESKSTIAEGIIEYNRNIFSWLKKIVPQPSFVYFKGTLLFSLTLLILILPFKAYTYYKSLDNLRGQVLGASEQGIGNLLDGGKQAVNLNFNEANENFIKASNNFLAAQNNLNEINGLIFVLANYLPIEDLRLAAASKDMLAVGQLSAELGSNLSLAIASIVDRQESTTTANENIIDMINTFNSYGNEAISNAQAIEEKLNKIDQTLFPEEYEEEFILLKEKMSSLTNGLVEFIDLMKKVEELIGATRDKRYLLVFQNNAETRASGGFIGSYALIDFSQGKITNLEVPSGGSYDTEAGLYLKMIAPEPLWLVNPLWHFWDANWWPDWPTTAKKLAWFYEKSDGPTVDGVISFTPTVIEQLLKIIGPVDLTEKYGLKIDAENFWESTQTIVERKPDIIDKDLKPEPKKIIGDMLEQIINQLPHRLNRENLLSLIQVIEELCSQKHILLYFTDEILENKVIDLGWSGEVKPTSHDYLSVINTNIAGGKSDRKISQVIEHKAEVLIDGSIIDTLTIRRTHNGIKREPFIGVRNVNWMRVYVPAGSELIEATGFDIVDQIYFEKPEDSWEKDEEVARAEAKAETDPSSGTKIYNELGKTVFANWSQVDPGQTTIITLKYKLPFKIYDLEEEESRSIRDKFIDNLIKVFNPWQKELFPYTLLVQKQPGANQVKISSQLIVPDFYRKIWSYPGDLMTNQDGWKIDSDLDSDKFWAIVFEK